MQIIRQLGMIWKAKEAHGGIKVWSLWRRCKRQSYSYHKNTIISQRTETVCYSHRDMTYIPSLVEFELSNIKPFLSRWKRCWHHFRCLTWNVVHRCYDKQGIIECMFFIWVQIDLDRYLNESDNEILILAVSTRVTRIWGSFQYKNMLPI